jgi:mannosylglycerate hydrolase
METTAPHSIIVVSHTHWDREWYHPLGVMRQRLTALVDGLIDQPDGLPFLLDGQAIVLDDYRLMRPERTVVLRQALSAGQIEAGPWYVLADLLMTSGESLTRNLLEGMRTVREAGGTPPPVLYSPDAFGHAAAGPLLAAEFGFGTAIVWRGFGGPDHPNSTVALWKHKSGARVLLYHLPASGYEIGSSLPPTAEAALARWRTMRDAVIGNNLVRVALLPNGADHHARQAQRADAIAALGKAVYPHSLEVDTLAGFARRIELASAAVKLPRVAGELRDSMGHTWSLQGTFATRAHQKRTNAIVDRQLVRDTEPWVALAWYLNGWSAQASLRMAWKTLLTTHPHDTLCGCSVDAVADAADQRWIDAAAQATAVRDDALRVLVDCNVVAERELESHWQPTLIVRNPSARLRNGVLHLRLIDAVVQDPVGPGSAARSGARVPPLAVAPQWSGDEHIQLLRRSRAFDRVESPQHYPRNAVVRETHALAYVADVAGYRAQPLLLSDLASIAQPVPVRERARATETTLNGPTWRISSSMQGVVATQAENGAKLQPLGWLESITDMGDTYTPSLRGEAIVARWGKPHLAEKGPIRAAWEFDSVIERPMSMASSATEPQAREIAARDIASITCTATLALHAGTDRIDISINGVNTACDHRLRWVLPLPGSLHTTRVIADAAFGAVERTRSALDTGDWGAETRLHSAPLHRWLYFTGDAYGLGIISDGLAEYELLPDGQLAITLVRAVGELSRRDLPERLGHAGWPMATPGAQSLGAFTAHFSLVTLPADVESALAKLEATADDVLTPLVADTWRGVATALSPCTGLTLEGDGLVFSAAKRSEDGEWLVLRCVNQRATRVGGTWYLPRAAQEVRVSRLDETPGAALSGTGAKIHFEAPPFGIVTLLVR